MRTLSISISFVFLFTSSISAQETSSFDSIVFQDDLNIQIAEMYRIGDQLQDQVWPGWSEASFAFLLVTESHEFLIRHPNPSEDFRFFRYDELIKDSIYVRTRVFSPNLRATFPAVGGIPTIVMGIPDSTESRTEWILTALHEHFHQWQMSRPDYYSAVNSLDLSGGDETGQWMLNYPFPYDSSEVVNQFRKLAMQLKLVLESSGTSQFTGNLKTYFNVRREFQSMLSVDDYRYFSFQVWQEGVARYVEYKTAKWAEKNYEPTVAFKKLGQFESFEEASRQLREKILHRLSDLSLERDRRISFYPMGAAECLLLDQINSDWPQGYWVEKFYLENLFGL